jgi:Arc-like DNA binding domain
VAKRQRAPGAGRPRGEPRSPLTVRLPTEMRVRLEAAARKRDRTITEELVARLRSSFNRGRDEARDPATRAFCFLFSELARRIYVHRELPNWHFDPWLFQTFKLAIPRLLDHFRPAGEMKLPTFWQGIRDDPGFRLGFPSTKEERQRETRSPDAMADRTVQKVLAEFSDPAYHEQELRNFESLEDMISDPHALQGFKEWKETFYGMQQARRDLAPQKSRGGKS